MERNALTKVPQGKEGMKRLRVPPGCDPAEIRNVVLMATVPGASGQLLAPAGPQPWSLDKGSSRVSLSFPSRTRRRLLPNHATRP